MTSPSISVKRRCSSVQCIFIPSQMKKQLVVPVMLLAGVGRRGTHHKHTLGLCCSNTQIQPPGAPTVGDEEGESTAAFLSLLRKQQLNWGCASKWLFPPLPQEKRGFQHHRTRTSRFTLFHLISIGGKVRSHPQVLLWQKPRKNEDRILQQLCSKKNSDWQHSSPFHSHLWNVGHERIKPHPLPFTTQNWSPFYAS